jgi:hypothetical protein
MVHNGKSGVEFVEIAMVRPAFKGKYVINRSSSVWKSTRPTTPADRNGSSSWVKGLGKGLGPGEYELF